MSAIGQRNCNLTSCDISLSYYHYRPSLAANGFFLFLFCVCLTLLLLHTFLSRTFLGFNIALLCGTILEIIGYTCRVIGSHEPFLESPYAAQYVCLTIAPAFIAASIYFCISRIVLTFGEAHSRLKAKQFPRIFIGCDVASILLQAGGGGTATGASHNGKSPDTGNDIDLAGLSFQVFTMCMFTLISCDYAWATVRHVLQHHQDHTLDPRYSRLRSSPHFKLFLVALAGATALIIIRCVFRLVEFSGGFQGPITKVQGLFIGLESVLILTAVFLLTAFHPHIGFQIVRRPKVLFGKKGRDREARHVLEDLQLAGVTGSTNNPPEGSHESQIISD